MRIPFAKPWIPDASKKHVAEAMGTGRIGRSDYYAAQCREHLQDLVNREFILLVNSGTMALQCALAARPEWDTVRVPDYTFGATANAVLLTGRKLILAEMLPPTHSIHVAMFDQDLNP
jgi:dTDP-4-amino-4,6-dideoxygalactose transaminase